MAETMLDSLYEKFNDAEVCVGDVQSALVKFFNVSENRRNLAIQIMEKMQDLRKKNPEKFKLIVKIFFGILSNYDEFNHPTSATDDRSHMPEIFECLNFLQPAKYGLILANIICVDEFIEHGEFVKVLKSLCSTNVNRCFKWFEMLNVSYIPSPVVEKLIEAIVSNPSVDITQMIASKYGEQLLMEIDKFVKEGEVTQMADGCKEALVKRVFKVCRGERLGFVPNIHSWLLLKDFEYHWNNAHNLPDKELLFLQASKLASEYDISQTKLLSFIKINDEALCARLASYIIPKLNQSQVDEFCANVDLNSKNVLKEMNLLTELECRLTCRSKLVRPERATYSLFGQEYEVTYVTTSKLLQKLIDDISSEHCFAVHAKAAFVCTMHQKAVFLSIAVRNGSVFILDLRFLKDEVGELAFQPLFDVMFGGERHCIAFNFKSDVYFLKRMFPTIQIANQHKMLVDVEVLCKTIANDEEKVKKVFNGRLENVSIESLAKSLLNVVINPELQSANWVSVVLKEENLTDLAVEVSSLLHGYYSIQEKLKGDAQELERENATSYSKLDKAASIRESISVNRGIEDCSESGAVGNYNNQRVVKLLEEKANVSATLVFDGEFMIARYEIGGITRVCRVNGTHRIPLMLARNLGKLEFGHQAEIVAKLYPKKCIKNILAISSIDKADLKSFKADNIYEHHDDIAVEIEVEDVRMRVPRKYIIAAVLLSALEMIKTDAVAINVHANDIKTVVYEIPEGATLKNVFENGVKWLKEKKVETEEIVFHCKQ